MSIGLKNYDYIYIYDKSKLLIWIQIQRSFYDIIWLSFNGLKIVKYINLLRSLEFDRVYLFILIFFIIIYSGNHQLNRLN